MAEIRGFVSTCRFNPAMRKQTSIFKSLSQKHDFWHCVRFVQPCHCDSARRHLCHLTKRCVCHEMTMCQRKALCLPRENDAIIMKSSAPATQNANATANACMLFARKPTSSTSSWARFVSAAHWHGFAGGCGHYFTRHWANAAPTSRPPGFLLENPSLGIRQKESRA